MRIWTLHPRYLDPKGLVALWRETLLARAVLAGRTRGYTQHPQLQRFAVQPFPLAAIDGYLASVLTESVQRGYRFDASRIGVVSSVVVPISATTGQRDHEWRHLRAKLAVRSPDWLARWADVDTPALHPLFALTAGPIAPWERP
ncbi:MAG TPA: pyrimidine dimer DNA glycosylase/endonuclease V [Ottowia sp.]|uniref:pyrimidine dimer DNA glycosylase/endonuclease V n=1 Tax=Ottowia sp. TaxID=1898956 RepID=UPI002CEBE326|nr:pyrimidine dimer DNA glycosylase/endonuclease V [Ottowia sp.]HMN20474.1 pyrimidine dimer DNA glycosylase/endonuclease V [Ottowia sp.]